MNCKIAQNHLLEDEYPDRPDTLVQVHLDSCSACQEWQCRVLLMEQHVPLLRVPPSTARADFVQKILAGLTTIETPDQKPNAGRRIIAFTAFHAQRFAPRTWKPTPKRLAAAGMAAAVLLVVFGWWALRDPSRIHAGPQASLDPLVKQLLVVNERLAVARTPAESVVGLADLADTLNDNSRSVARADQSASSKEVLMDLAQRYRLAIQGNEKVKGVVQCARALPADERRRLLEPLAERLSKAEREAQALAEELPALAEPLRVIAAAARDGEKEMRAVAQRDQRTVGVTAQVAPAPKGETP